MEASTQRAIDLLTGLGFRTSLIPVGETPTADFRIDAASETYFVEVKEKLDAEPETKQRQAILNAGEIYSEDHPLKYNNRISSILREARQQLDETPRTETAFQIIWFQASGIDADLKYRQAFSTFYGDVPLIALEPRIRNATVHCFYFDHSEAFKLKSIDALILVDHTTLQVCLNEFSTRVGEFRQSSFFKRFEELDAIIDPAKLLATNQIITCGLDVPRKDDDEVCRALQKQTGVLYTTIRLRRHAFSAAVAYSDEAATARTSSM